MQVREPFSSPVLVRSNGQMVAVLPKDAKLFTIEELYELLECKTVQVVYSPSGVEMWMDENGKLDGKPINKIATLFWKLTYHGYEIGADDFMVGNILYIPAKYQENAGN